MHCKKCFELNNPILSNAISMKKAATTLKSNTPSETTYLSEEGNLILCVNEFQ